MRSIFPWLALLGVGSAHVLARRVEQQPERRAIYQGGFPLITPHACPANSSTACGSKSDVNQLCCPTGNSCFGGTPGFCCATTQNCNSYVDTFPACADPTAIMYVWVGNNYFCCAPGFTAVVPTNGYPFCETPDVSVAASLLATMVNQYGAAPTGASVTTTGAGAVTPTAGYSNPTPTLSSTSPTQSPSSGSGFAGLSQPALIGIGIAALIAFSIAIAIWTKCKRKARMAAFQRQQAYLSRPPAYTAPSVQIYEPVPTRLHNPNNLYDPILDRRVAAGPRSPSPMSPSPAYSTLDPREIPEVRDVVDSHELPEGRGTYDPVEAYGVGTTRGRVEMG